MRTSIGDVASNGFPAPAMDSISDKRDPRYLRHDPKKAVEDSTIRAIHPDYLILDPNAERNVARIFGDNSYAIVDHVEQLPERLPAVFAALTG